MYVHRLRCAIAAVGLALFVASCMTAVSRARVTSQSASHAYIVPLEIVRGLDSAGRSASAVRRERLRLPGRINAYEDEFYWVVPVCGGRIRADLADSYQYSRGEPIDVRCQ